MGVAETIIGYIVYFFSDLIFLNIFGFAVIPAYNAIERSVNKAIANSFLIIIEIIFYSLVLTGIILLCERVGKDRKAAKKDKRIDSETKKELEDNKETE